MTRGLHIGFAAPSREHVDAFWRAGTEAGYRDDGAPGPRPQYGDDCYGGFLLDPDGNSADLPERAQFAAEGGSFSLVDGSPTRRAHIAFVAAEAATLTDPDGNVVELVAVG